MVRAPSYVQTPAFQPRPLTDGALLRTLGSCALGDFIGIGWKGTRISLVGRKPCSPPHGPRTPAHGPLLEGRETRYRDRIPVTRLVLLQQPVANQQPDATLTDLDRRNHDHAPGAALAEPPFPDRGWCIRSHITG